MFNTFHLHTEFPGRVTSVREPNLQLGFGRSLSERMLERSRYL